MHDGREERSGGQYDSGGKVSGIPADSDADHPNSLRVGLGEQIENGLLPEIQVRLSFDHVLDLGLVSSLIRLSTGAVHGGTLPPIEHAKLDAGRVDGPAHGAPERVDFTDDLALSDSANGRIATHLTNRITVGRQQRGLCTESRSREGGLGTGMSSPDHNYVIFIPGSRHRPIIVSRWRP